MISTHTPLARRDEATLDGDTAKVISTHTPLARRDSFFIVNAWELMLISTHTPLARRDSKTIGD